MKSKVTVTYIVLTPLSDSNVARLTELLREMIMQFKVDEYARVSAVRMILNERQSGARRIKGMIVCRPFEWLTAIYQIG